MGDRGWGWLGWNTDQWTWVLEQTLRASKGQEPGAAAQGSRMTWLRDQQQ